MLNTSLKALQKSQLQLLITLIDSFFTTNKLILKFCSIRLFQTYLIFPVTTCMKVPDITNADSQVTKWIYTDLYLPQTEVGYKCRDGLTMVPDTFDGRICRNDGLWHVVPVGTTPLCVRGEFKLL